MPNKSGMPKIETPSPAPIILSTTLPTTTGYFPEGMPLAYLIATVVTGLGILIASHVYMSRPEQVAHNSVSATVVAEPASVGRITGTVDCHWTGGSRVSLGQKCQLASGLMEITYNTGAKVILQGPATYEVESANGGFMSVGKLIGKVEVEKAKGFFVRTPTAVVTDLGTEFGVEVSKKGATVSHVYCGRVVVRVLANNGMGREQVIPLGTNESVQVTLDEAKVVKVIHNTSKTSSSTFVRGMPRRVPIKLFSTGVGLNSGDADPHWQLVARSNDPKFKPRPAVAISNPASLWVANEPDRSQWIGFPEVDVTDGVVYTFRTTFQLADVYLGTAILQGMFAADNHVRVIRLNGHKVRVPEHGYDEYSFCIFHPFSYRGGFVEGAQRARIRR